MATFTSETAFSCFCFHPRCLQFFNTVRWHVFWQCMYLMVQGFLVNGLINIVLVALETRFGLSSSRSAVIVSSHDFGAVLFIVIVGYFGEKCHKPRVMASGIFLMSFGSFLFALPHFISEPYQYTVSGASNSSTNICNDGNNSTSSNNETTNGSYTLYYGVMILGSLLLGIGHVPTFVLGLGYIDENSEPRDSAFHMGFTFCAGALGGAIGYVAGGQTLKLFVDMDRVDVDSINGLSPSDPQWVGAWWLGVLEACVMFFLVAFPIFGYPRHLPDYEQLKKSRQSEVYKGKSTKSEQQSSEKSTCSGIKSHVENLGKNPTFWLLIISATLEVFIITGLSTFGAKILQQYFGVSPSEAGYLMGFVTVPGSGGGVLLGGYLVKRFNLTVKGIIRMCGVCLFTCVLLGPAYLSVCPRDPIIGVTVPYDNQTIISLTSSCNNDCGCTTSGYEPLCDGSNMQYFSPCHAGCTVLQNNTSEEKVYHNCKCSPKYTVIREGTCTSKKCPWFYLFCVLLFLLMVLTFTTMSPLIQAMLRCIPQEERSFALGLELLFGRLLGTTPGPLFVGAIIDGECLVWQQTGNGTGSCWIYAKSGLSIKIMCWWMGSKLLGTLLLFLADRTYKPPLEDERTEKVYYLEFSEIKTEIDPDGSLSTYL